jgi:hypothetical protein
MIFDIAISRAASFARAQFAAGAGVKPLKGEALHSAFQGLAETVASHPSLIGANEAIWKRVIALDPAAEKRCLPSHSRDGTGELVVLNAADDFSAAGNELRDSQALVARMRSKIISVRIADMAWILRTRASVTSCALEGNVRPTKLWWTFEGIPADTNPDRRPTEHHVKAFLDVVAELERAGRDGLRIAYQEALPAAVKAKGKAKLRSHAERLNITLTECVNNEVDSLLDAMYLDEQGVSDIRSSEDEELEEARVGMSEFERFVHCVAGSNARIEDASVTLATEIPRVKAVLWHGQEATNKLVVGFARRVGAKVGLGLLTPDERRAELTEERIRLRSAARPLSALLASKHAGTLDRALRHVQP